VAHRAANACGPDQGVWITLKLGSLYNRLGKAGARLRVPLPRHQNQNPADAFSFREELCARIRALNLPPQRPVRVWVLDEMRHGLHGFTRRGMGSAGASLRGRHAADLPVGLCLWCRQSGVGPS
jgi:hypothetical protein